RFFLFAAKKDEPEFWLMKWLRDLLPNRRDEIALAVFQTDSREIVMWLDGLVPQNASLSPDGHSLLVLETADNACTLSCWDIPEKKPWRWILGVPAGLGLLLVVPYQAWKRRRVRKASALA